VVLIRGTRIQVYGIYNIIFCGLRFVGENTNKGKKHLKKRAFKIIIMAGNFFIYFSSHPCLSHFFLCPQLDFQQPKEIYQLLNIPY